MLDNTTLAAEFLRRLRHQLGMKRIHDEGCRVGYGCPTAKLISCGIADSWTTLSGCGFSREANDIIEAHDRRESP